MTPYSNPPTCSAGCSLHFFVSPSSIANWEPQQLIEYTLGAAPANTQRVTRNRPVLLVGPRQCRLRRFQRQLRLYAGGNRALRQLADRHLLRDRLGRLDSHDSTRSITRSLIGSVDPIGTGWPLYVDQSSTTTPKATVPGKVPSALEIFLNYNSFNNTSNYSPAPSKSTPIIRMKTLWEDCTGTDPR